MYSKNQTGYNLNFKFKSPLEDKKLIKQKRMLRVLSMRLEKPCKMLPGEFLKDLKTYLMAQALR
jgi:hypothetical protein